MNILIAEDDAVSRLILRRTIDKLGHTCLIAADGREAWELLQATQVDVVISDWMMPYIDGVELCRRVRKIPPFTTPYIYFIIFSGLSDRSHFLEAMGEGADDYLSKPLDAIELRVRLAVAERVTSVYRELAAQKAQSDHQALHDPLTKLPNRLLFHDRLRQALRKGTRDGIPFALLLLDLDGFKKVNDTHGHQRGDLVLQEVGRRLTAVLRESDTVARLGGDEFGIVVPTAQESGAVAIVHKILVALQLPLQIDDLHIEIGGAIGIALFPVHGSEEQVLLHAADVAMYTAKRSGHGYAFGAERRDVTALSQPAAS